MPRLDWTRDQLLIALRLYMRTPFGKLHKTNPEIVELAAKLGRTPSALGMKACNFAALDPNLKQKGLSGASQADRAIWLEFEANPEALANEAELAVARLTQTESIEPDIRIPPGETDVERIVRARRVQSFFRSTVLVTYQSRCAITGLAIPELLVASHIIPWSESVERRADPTNGLCLNALFDKAFDRGLIAIDDRFRVMVSPRLTDRAAKADLHCSLLEIEGRQLSLPKRFVPDLAALAWHRGRVFGTV